MGRPATRSNRKASQVARSGCRSRSRFIARETAIGREEPLHSGPHHRRQFGKHFAQVVALSTRFPARRPSPSVSSMIACRACSRSAAARHSNRPVRSGNGIGRPRKPIRHRGRRRRRLRPYGPAPQRHDALSLRQTVAVVLVVCVPRPLLCYANRFRAKLRSRARFRCHGQVVNLIRLHAARRPTSPNPHDGCRRASACHRRRSGSLREQHTSRFRRN